MTSAVAIKPSPQPAPPAPPRLLPIPHSAESMDGIPWFDEEFQMPQSNAHRDTIKWICEVLDEVAEQAHLTGVSDYPIWYWIAEEGKQRALYPDYALAATSDIKGLTAADVLLGLEVVSTERAAKERKDSVLMRARSEDNQIAEFVLLYPEMTDARTLFWFRYDHARGAYRALTADHDGRYRSQAIPGLEVEVLAPADWKPGQKIRLYFRGQELFGIKETRAQAEEAKRQAEDAKRQAEEAKRQAEDARQAVAQAEAQAAQERQEKERLLALLKQAGMHLDQNQP